MQMIVDYGLILSLLPSNKVYTKAEACFDLYIQAYHTEPVIKNKATLPHGFIYTSINQLATKWQWSRTKTDAFIKELAENGTIQLHRSEGAGNNKMLIKVNTQYFTEK